MSSYRKRFLFVWLTCVCPVGVAVATPPAVQGKLDHIGPYRVLRVWGTPQDMGFAHGYLLAEEILAMVSPHTDARDAKTVAGLEVLRQRLRSNISLPVRIRQELEAMHEGIVARLGDDAVVALFNRPITVDDLVLFNAGDLLRLFACSGFTVWGEKAGKLEVITTRNFDFDIRGKLGVDHQLIIVRRPDKSRHAVATVAWPGYIGAFTGVNDAGVCTFMHDGTGGRTLNLSRATRPLALTLTMLLEQMDPENAHLRASRALLGMKEYPFSYLVRVVSPVAQGDPPSPEWVFRIDPSGVSRNPLGVGQCITTNHYLTDELKPVPEAGAWSLTRYQRIEEGLASIVTPETAWAIQRRVASAEQTHPTAHTLVVYPTQRRLDLALATWQDKVTPAPESPPLTVSFDELFNP